VAGGAAAELGKDRLLRLLVLRLLSALLLLPLLLCWPAGRYGSSVRCSQNCSLACRQYTHMQCQRGRQW
jgi:hypothetical protein